MSIKSKLSLVALMGAVAATSIAAPSANARQFHLPPCDLISWGSCGDYALMPPPPPVSRSRDRDISPDYMKASDPRYNTLMGNAGGGGGGCGGGGGGGGGGGR
jgi:hypothetical protein